jgi:hypothetical protein
MPRAQAIDVVEILKPRLEKNLHRHRGVAWSEVEERIALDKAKLRALAEMERTGGEPDVVGRDAATGEVVFCDCSAESPTGRRSLCYDRAGRDSRKEHKPIGSAVDAAASMGVDLLTEGQYRELQELEEFDLKTSSWVATPEGVRKLGGAIFCDRRYGRVFTYHNGADSYYSARGFRGRLLI